MYPVRGTTGLGRRAVVRHVISIHVPRAGYDFCLDALQLQREAISIHVPRAGYDGDIRRLFCRGRPFLSTYPVRGTTYIEGGGE